MTLTEEIGAAGGTELSSKAEARKLAFYLFWNIKPYFDRCPLNPSTLTHLSCSAPLPVAWCQPAQHAH